MNGYFFALATGGCIATLVLTLVWTRQLFTRNAGIVDGWWAINFPILTAYYSWIGSGSLSHKLLILLIVLTWGIRLGIHLLIRNSRHGTEDVRYATLRTEYGTYEHLRMWLLFFYQALSNALLSVPFLLICMNAERKFHWLTYLGIGIWTIGFVGETFADRQLRKFKEQASNRGRVCNEGLWKYSRHPNYFFEWVIWISFSVIANDSPYGWLALGAPLIMYILLTRVTGIPMLETLSLKSKGVLYADYQKTTSAFVPWFNKKIGDEKKFKS